jgi:Flp pilus assembly protein CpaB
MRNKRFVIVLGGAVVFGLVAAMSVSKYLSSAQAYAKNLSSVMVAKVAINPGEKIIAEQLEPVQFPRGATPDGTFESADKLVGRVAVVSIAAREPITDFKLPAENTQQDPISKIVLQNIKVLANGQNIDKPKSEREPESVKAVTLQVTPEQAERLALASTEGKLQLVMRNAVDQDDEQTQGVDKRRLLGGEHAAPIPDAGTLKSEQPKPSQPATPHHVVRVAPAKEEKPAQAAAPAPPPPPRHSVEVIEGSKKRSVDFPN